MARTLIASLCATLVLVLALLFIPWPSAKRSAAGGSSAAEKSSPGGASRIGNSPPSKLPREERTPHKAEAEPGPSFTSTHTPEQLKDFIIPRLSINEATLNDAVSQLLQTYEAVCSQTGQAPIPFTAEIRGGGRELISVDLSGRSFLTALRILAARAGVAFDRVGTALVFSPPAESAWTGGTISSYSRPVPPTILRDLRDLAGDRADGDPDELLSLLRQLGVMRTGGNDISASYNASQGTLELSGSPEDLARLDAFLAEAFQPPRQIKYTSKVLTSSQKLDFLEGQILSPDALAVALRTASDRKLGALSLPSLVLRQGQLAKLRIPGEEAPVMITRAVPYGFGFSTFASANPARVQGTGPEHGAMSESNVVPPGHWVVRSQETTDGTHRYVLLNPTPIDAPGGGTSPQSP